MNTTQVSRTVIHIRRICLDYIHALDLFDGNWESASSLLPSYLSELPAYKSAGFSYFKCSNSQRAQPWRDVYPLWGQRTVARLLIWSGRAGAIVSNRTLQRFLPRSINPYIQVAYLQLDGLDTYISKSGERFFKHLPRPREVRNLVLEIGTSKGDPIMMTFTNKTEYALPEGEQWAK